MQGKIIKWDDEKGFGFIKSEEQTENIFAHASHFRNKTLRPAVGDIVEFTLKNLPKVYKLAILFTPTNRAAHCLLRQIVDTLAMTALFSQVLSNWSCCAW